MKSSFHTTPRLLKWGFSLTFFHSLNTWQCSLTLRQQLVSCVWSVVPLYRPEKENMAMDQRLILHTYLTRNWISTEYKAHLQERDARCCVTHSEVPEHQVAGAPAQGHEGRTRVIHYSFLWPGCSRAAACRWGRPNTHTHEIVINAQTKSHSN